MASIQYGNYVKFIRGTISAWNNMLDSEKSSDTLYFISDTGSATGRLYLGSKLISNGELSTATSLKQLNDVLIAEGITDQSVLVYNSSTEKWENKSILDIFLSMNEVFKGATETADGVSGLVPIPKAGEQDLFLKADATWANPVAGISIEVEEIQQKLITLIGEDVDLSIREIAQDEASTAVAEIVAQAPEQFDTLKEIADWIQANQGAVDVAGLTTRVTSLEEALYGVEETPGLVAVVNTLQTTVDTMDETLDAHDADIAEIKAAIKWQDIIENTNT